MSVTTLIDRLRRYSKGVTSLRRDDVILSSYPKSGNTWVRFFFCNLINRVEGNGDTVTFEAVDRMMPEFAVSDLSEPWPYKSVPRIVKSHNPWWLPFRNCRSIYIVRDPRDAMVSHFHYVTGRKNARFSGDFSEFIRTKKWGLHNWFRHVESWMPHATVTLKYEDLLADDITQFRRAIDAVGVKVDDALLVQAVEDSRFKKLKAVVEEHGHAKDDFKPGFNFMRKGRSNEWVELFTAQDIALYEEMKAKSSVNLYP